LCYQADKAAATFNESFMVEVRMSLHVRRGYHPSEDEEYMNSNQLAYFRELLNGWRLELEHSARMAIASLQDTTSPLPDPVDQATANAGLTLDHHARQRQLQLIREIDYALMRIEDGEYGYCEITGEAIGIRRLLARPAATMCVEVQERRERMMRFSGSHAHA
jgi:DnaK suppressor protein